MAGRVLIIPVCLLVAGCSGPLPDLLPEFHQRAETAPVAEPLYCYRTLGRVNCHTRPLDGREANRLVGYEGPSPLPNAGTGPLVP